jgi:hypothetical protein
MISKIKFPKASSAWVKHILVDTLGLKDIMAYGTIWNGLRHAVIAYRNSPRNTEGKPKGVELAVLMRHAPGTQKVSYENGDFLTA